MNLHLPSHPKDHPYTCARVEDQGQVGPRQSWLDRVRPKEHNTQRMGKVEKGVLFTWDEDDTDYTSRKKHKGIKNKI